MNSQDHPDEEPWGGCTILAWIVIAFAILSPVILWVCGRLP